MAEPRRHLSKPVLCCWMGDASVREAREVLAAAAIPSFRTPEAAVGAFGNIASFYQNQQLLQQTPPPLSTWPSPTCRRRAPAHRKRAGRAAQGAHRDGDPRPCWRPSTSRSRSTMLARSANEAMMIATQLGYPVALKIDSPDISHKSDVQRRGAERAQRRRGARPSTTEMIQAVARPSPVPASTASPSRRWRRRAAARSTSAWSPTTRSAR
jgi:acetyltransferase